MSETKLPEDFWTVEVPVDPLAMVPDVGADLTKIEAHTSELESIVQQMWEDMTTETKLLDGMEVPEREELIIPRTVTEDVWRAMQVATRTEPSVQENECTSTEESPSTE